MITYWRFVSNSFVLMTSMFTVKFVGEMFTKSRQLIQKAKEGTVNSV